MEVARATSSPIRSSIRRSTPGIGEAVHSSAAAWTTARFVKSALRFMGLALQLMGQPSPRFGLGQLPCGLRPERKTIGAEMIAFEILRQAAGLEVFREQQVLFDALGAGVGQAVGSNSDPMTTWQHCKGGARRPITADERG